MTGLLSDLTVVEVSAFVAAPYAGLSLAQLGATVIRIDPIGGGLDSNRWPLSNKGKSLYWAGLNKGKKSITIDVKQPEARELAQALMTMPGKDRGFILSNLKPKGWLDFELLKSKREDIIMVNIIGNSNGSVAIDYTVNARAGFPLVTGPSNHNGPINHVIPIWDILTGSAAANAILIAERWRRDTGEGQYIKIPLANSAFSILSHLGYIAEAELNKVDRPRLGNKVYGSFASDFRTKDGRRVIITAFTKNHWRALQEATGLVEYFSTFEKKNKVDLNREENRYAHSDAIASALMPWFLDRNLTEIKRILESKGVCWAPYQTFRQGVEEDPDLSVLNPMFEEIEQPDIGRYRAAGPFIDFTNIDKEPVKAAPHLGQDTDEVLATYLQMSDKQIARLHDKGLISGPNSEE